ncbi:MAG TPA: phenylalanine--tRNA ligase subunit beta, partial [Alphaproteobacteria bacterium]|nr:phenylalanine--tRNA ligase subunit beta [Alphaproteobacteria bacterium]
YHPGRSGCLRLGPKLVLGWFGELHPRVLDRLDVAGPLVGFEVFLERPPAPKAGRTRTRAKLETSDFPAVQRDFAFIVDAEVQADALVRAARGADKALITEVGVFDVYAGQGIEPGRKSVAITVRLEPEDRTLTDAEIDAVADKVVGAVAKATGATLRG